MKKLLSLAMIATLPLMAACSETGAAGRDEAKTSASPTSAVTTAGPSGAKQSEAGAIGDVTGFKCSESKGVWTASFKAKNNGDKRAQYRFVVNVTNAKNQVVGSKEQQTEVDAKKESAVTVKEVYKGKAGEKLKCFVGAYKKDVG